MDILTWVLVGLIAGVIAKLLMGNSFGWIVTILLGIVGAFVGGRRVSSRKLGKASWTKCDEPATS